MQTVLILACAVSILTIGAMAAETPAKLVTDFSLDSIDGKPYPLAQHKGQVLLLVNVASRCGYTPQYTGLQAVHVKYHDKGFNVIGIPANEFGAQEPGTNEEIQKFCSSKYKVTFPMMAKTAVKGDAINPLYKHLTVDGPKPGAIAWNFNKFLIGRNGQVIERFDSKVKPDDPKLIAAVEKALAEK